jgi:hypothetical protein
MTDLPYIPVVGENASVITRKPVKYEGFNAWYTFQPTFASTKV